MVLTWQFPPPIAFTISPSTIACASLYPSLLEGWPTTSQKENSSWALTIVLLILEQVIFIFVTLFSLSSTSGVVKLLTLLSALAWALFESIELVTELEFVLVLLLFSARIVLYEILLGL